MLFRFLLIICWFGSAFSAAQAQESWKVRKLENTSAYNQAIAERRPAAPSGIRDMRLASAPRPHSTIARAWYGEPTQRYRHGILGDATEAGELVVELTSGERLSYRLPETEVFEDIAPRIANLDASKEPEIVTILSSVNKGASVSVFGVSANRIVKLASTAFIGQPNRWLNVAGIERYMGANTPEIAFVTTPHIGGNLRFVRYDRGKLRSLAGASGYSNHVIGSRELRLSASRDINGDGKQDLALPSANRRVLRIMGFRDGTLDEIGRADLPSPVNKPVIASGSGKNVAFTVGLENGSVYEIRR